MELCLNLLVPISYLCGTQGATHGQKVSPYSRTICSSLDTGWLLRKRNPRKGLPLVRPVGSIGQKGGKQVGPYDLGQKFLTRIKVPRVIPKRDYLKGGDWHYLEELNFLLGMQAFKGLSCLGRT